MKTLRYGFWMALIALTLVGCEDVREQDENLIATFDHTKPALVMFEHGLKAVCSASHALVGALNLDHYLSTTDPQARLELEDRYYPYSKVREEEDGCWKIYTEYKLTKYHLQDGLLLREPGSLWRLLNHPYLFKTEDQQTAPMFECSAPDCFDVTLPSSLMTSIGGLYTYNLHDYLRAWNLDHYYLVRAGGELSLETNNSAFRAGESEALRVVVCGSVTLRDQHREPNYTEHFTITEPLELYFGEDGLMAEGTIGCGSMTITNTYGDRVVATMSAYNVIHVEFYPKGGGYYIGFYDWLGNNISPQN